MNYVKESMRYSLENHQLHEVLKTGIPLTPLSTGPVKPFRVFQMCEDPKSRMMMVTLIFSPEGIVIYGDLGPERGGVISNLGYGVEWFSGKLSEGYLCEKFLTTEWVDEKVGPHLEGLLERSREEPEYYKREKSQITSAFLPASEKTFYLHDELELALAESWTWSSVEVGDISMNLYEYQIEFGHIIDKYGLDSETAYPDFGYRRSTAGWLCAIQQRFAELYEKEK